MDEEVKKECENCEELRKQFKKQNAKNEKRISELEAKVKQLTELLEKSQRSGKRQAAPFRKKKKKDPKKPGRKKGDDYGKQAFREVVPSPNEVTERFEVPLPKKCPCCNGKEIEITKTDRQYQYEIPTEPIIPRIHHRRWRLPKLRTDHSRPAQVANFKRDRRRTNSTGPKTSCDDRGAQQKTRTLARQSAIASQRLLRNQNLPQPVL